MELDTWHFSLMQTNDCIWKRLDFISKHLELRNAMMEGVKLFACCTKKWLL